MENFIVKSLVSILEFFCVPFLAFFLKKFCHTSFLKLGLAFLFGAFLVCPLKISLNFVVVLLRSSDKGFVLFHLRHFNTKIDLCWGETFFFSALCLLLFVIHKSDVRLRESDLTFLSLIVCSFFVFYGSSLGIIKTSISPKGFPYGWVGGDKKVPITKGGRDEAIGWDTLKAWNRTSKTTKEVGA